jgi:hypothetical protein
MAAPMEAQKEAIEEARIMGRMVELWAISGMIAFSLLKGIGIAFYM